MLGNNADAFFNTAMKTSVVSGGNVKMARNEMPAPRSLALSGRTLGADPVPAAAPAPEKKTIFGMPLMVALGLAAVGGFLLLRKKAA